jgi:two-component system chemotaxis sensor kinase CheA
VSGVDPTQVYRQEAEELLQRLEDDLLDLERTPGDPDLVDSIFRALHTLKGSGAMYGFDRVAAFTHHVETAFDAVRNDEASVTPALIAVTLAARDHIRGLIECPDTTDDAAGRTILAGLEAPGPPAGAPPATTWRIGIRLARDVMANGTNPLLLLDELRDLGDCTVVADTSAVPPLEDLQPADCHVGWTVALTTTAPRSTIEQVFLFVIDDMELTIEPVDADPGAPAVSVVDALVPERAAVPPPSAASSPARVAGDSIGELVIAQSRLRQLAASSSDPQIKAIAEDIERLALALRDTTMGVRMVPIGSLFGRFRRLVRDLSVELGKEIDLTTTGEDTELDKTMIERLNDPLVHLIRNAVDHGLEPPEARVAKGKPPTGRITMAARHAGHEVLISVTDDGRGLDHAAIRARAERNGLIPPGVRPTEAELVHYLFHPGFSTAREITKLSGRGVGLDVVRQTIEGLRGSIDVTAAAPGTCFAMRLPLTLAIIDGLLVRVGGGRYVIPLSAVEECVELDAAADAKSRGRSFLSIRGRLVPYLRLREMFASTVPPDLHQKAVIVSAADHRVGLVVDQVIGEHQTVIKSLSRLHASAGLFSGATILSDGTVALILEIAHLVERGQGCDDRLAAAV